MFLTDGLLREAIASEGPFRSRSKRQAPLCSVGEYSRNESIPSHPCGLRRAVKAVLQGLPAREEQGSSPSLGLLFPEMSPALRCHHNAVGWMAAKPQPAAVERSLL